MNEYYDYDEALKVNRERKRKAAALKRKRQAQIRLIKRNILCAVILVALTLLVIQFLRHIVPDISRQNELKQEMVLADTGNYDDVITVVQEKPTFRYALKSVMYKEMTDTDIQSPYIALLDATDNEFIAGKQINTRIYPASMTKVMSLIIAVENIKDLNETYKFGFDELNYLYIEQASVAGFSVDEEVKAKDLLYGLVLPSGADAAYGITIWWRNIPTWSVGKVPARQAGNISPPVCSSRRSISPNRQEPLKPRWTVLPRSTPEIRKRKPSPC